MRKREVIEAAVGNVLDATTADQVGDVIKSVSDQSSDRRCNARSEAAKADMDFEMAQANRQILFAALTELACREAVRDMSDYFRETGSLVSQDDDCLKTKIERFDTYSPTTQRFLKTMDRWFGTALRQIIEDGRKDKMPQAAIMTAGASVHNDYINTYEIWKRDSRKRTAEVARRHENSFTPTLESEIVDVFLVNFRTTAGIQVDAGTLYHDIAPTSSEKASFALDELDRIADLSSVVKMVSMPILDDTGATLQKYSAWELKEITGDELTARSSEARKAGVCLHASLKDGPWEKRRGFCTADVKIMRPELFAVPPQDFLRQLGVNNPAEEVNMTRIFLAAGALVARDTIYANWPTSSTQQ